MRKTSLDLGLLSLRAGVFIAFALLLVFRQSVDVDVLFLNGPHWFLFAILGLCTIGVTCGLFTRPAAAVAAVIWACAAFVGLHAGEPWFAVPVRDWEFACAFAALAFTGSGRFSASRWLQTKIANMPHRRIP